MDLRHWLLVLCLWVNCAAGWAGTRTWDGRYSTERIQVTVAYFVPADRQPLPDWRERVQYFCRRIELFHLREFGAQSQLTTAIAEAPVISARTTSELRNGDANAIFFRTLQEVEQRLQFARDQSDTFPILLVLSDINWRPLDDFYRLKPQPLVEQPQTDTPDSVLPRDLLVFEGNYTDGQHFPGAESGGARASYLADRGVGWGLVSADGWRVPYRGSDCVVYHEGCGHTVGLPHPEPGDGSVMSLGQYRGWLNESWLDKDQKIRMGWQPEGTVSPASAELELFSQFRAVPDPLVPVPGQPIQLQLDWPEKAEVSRLRVRFQTSLESPWIEVPQTWQGRAPQTAQIGVLDRETPVSYRVDAVLSNGATAELWGYLQVRSLPSRTPQPHALPLDLLSASALPGPRSAPIGLPQQELDLLQDLRPDACWQTGQWSLENGRLLSPKQYGARLQLPWSPPDEYRLSAIVEPLDEPNGLILGQRVGGNRFLMLVNYTPEGSGLSAIENVDGRNVGNETTVTGNVFQKNRLSHVLVTVTRQEILLHVDGRLLIHWRGRPQQLSLSEYWNTPDASALFLGA